MLRLFFLLLLLPGCGSAINTPQQSVSTFTPNTGQSENINPGWVKIIVLDVGQGDETLLLSPDNKATLIDTGPPEKGPPALFPVLKDFNITHLEHIFISHHHEDHIGGLQTLLNNGLANAETVIDKTNAKVGETFLIGPATLQIKAANGIIGDQPRAANADQDENNLSLALLLEYEKFRYFTDGDLPGGGGDPPYQTIDLETPLAPLIGDVDVILIPHHGSHTSTNQNFLDHLKPEVGIISLGDENDFFHPHPSTMARLKKAGVKIYTTERGSITDSSGINIVHGNICLLTNGETYLIKPYTIDKCSPPSL